MILPLLTSACLLLSSASPSEILEHVDKAATRASDATITLGVSVSAPGRAALSRTLRIWQRGDGYRLVKFLEPARLRGTGILVREGQTYLYSRAYDRVRRIAGLAGGGSFMGTGFSIDDLARVRYAGDYTAALDAETGAVWTLLLTPRETAEHSHAYLRLEVRKQDHLLQKLEALDSEKAVLRTIQASDFRTVGGYPVAHRLEVVEHRTDKRTVATVSEIVFDSGLSLDDFTTRALRRGR
jgi:hypothetical protein